VIEDRIYEIKIRIKELKIKTENLRAGIGAGLLFRKGISFISHSLLVSVSSV
jgi:hypothetical protein